MPELIRIGDLSVAAEIPPNASRPPILLIHGILGGAWYFANYQRFFATRGYPSYAVNLRGRPGSRAVPDVGRISMEEFVDDALEVARALGRPIVIGHSMGGLIAQRLAEERVADIVVLLSPAPPHGISVATPRLMAREVKHLWPMLRSKPITSSRSDSDALILNRIPSLEREALHRTLLPDSGRAAREIALGTVRVDERAVRCAMLVASGLDDRFIAPRIVRRVATKYGAPCWQYPGNAHFLPQEPGWERIIDDVESWISRRLPGPTSTAH